MAKGDGIYYYFVTFQVAIFQNSCLYSWLDFLTRFLIKVEIKSKFISTLNQKSRFHYKKLLPKLTVFLRNITIIDQWKILRARYEALEELGKAVSTWRIWTCGLVFLKILWGNKERGDDELNLFGGWGLKVFCMQMAI